MEERKIEIHTGIDGAQKAEEALSSINEKSLLSKKINPDKESKSESFLNSDSGIENIVAPIRKRSSFGMTKKVKTKSLKELANRKKRIKAQKKSRKINRSKK